MLVFAVIFATVALPVAVIFPVATLPKVNEVVVGILTVIVPELTIGLPDTDNVELFTPTLVTVPPNDVALIVTLPFPPETLIPEPALTRVTPVLVTVMFPFDVIGPPLI